MNPLISPARSVPGTRSAGILESGLIALVSGQSYIDVVFPSTLLGTSWSVLASVMNTIDSAPLNIWPGILTAKSTLGFTMQLNGMPDSSNYYLCWVIAPGGVLPDATTYTLSGPSTGEVGAASAPFTVALPVGLPVTGTVTVTPHDGGGGGTFTPATVNLTTAAPSTTFTYTAASSGAKTISVTNTGGLTNPGNLTYTAAFDPGSIAGLKLWLKADSLALADGTPVSTWADSSSNGNNATNTGSARPTFKINIVNGKPVVRYSSGSLNVLNLASAISSVSPWTVITVFGSGAGVYAISIAGTPGASPIGPSFLASGIVAVSNRANTVSTLTNPYAGAFHVFSGLSGGTLPSLYADGSLASTPTTTPSVTSGDFTGAGATSSDMDMAEIIVYNVQLSPTDRAAVESYLRTKYATP